jgi:hypothetical protein
MISMRRFAFAFLLVAGLCSVLAQTKDALIGTWLLDLTKSSFDPGPPPDGARTMIFEAVDNGFKHTTRTKTQNNGAFDVVIEYTAKYDGKDYRMDPEASVDMVSLKRIDANTVERTGKVRGKVAETVTFKVSPNGKTLTVTTKGTFQGDDYSSVQVFDKQ